jgi:CopG family nickel-responsive transcriptional regulator
MAKLVRFGVSIEETLIRKFDAHIRGRRYRNRSEAIRDLIREAFIRDEWKKGGKVAGGIVFVYDHHQRNLADVIMDIQHDFRDIIVSTQHVHLDHDNCLEVVTVRGRADRVEALYGAIKALKGVKHAGVIRTTSGA